MSEIITVPGVSLLPPLSGHFQPGHPLNQQAGEALSQVLKEVGRLMSPIVPRSQSPSEINLLKLDNGDLEKFKTLCQSGSSALLPNDPRLAKFKSLISQTDDILNYRQGLETRREGLSKSSETMSVPIIGAEGKRVAQGGASYDSDLFPETSSAESYRRISSLPPAHIQSSINTRIKRLNSSGSGWSDNFVEKQLTALVGELHALADKTSWRDTLSSLTSLEQPWRLRVQTRLQEERTAGDIKNLRTPSSPVAGSKPAGQSEPSGNAPTISPSSPSPAPRNRGGYIQAPDYEKPLPPPPPYVNPILHEPVKNPAFPDKSVDVDKLSRPFSSPAKSEDPAGFVYVGANVEAPKRGENIMHSVRKDSPAPVTSQGAALPDIKSSSNAPTIDPKSNSNNLFPTEGPVVFVTRAQANKLRAQGRSVIDVSSRGAEPYRQLSPFYPHGNIPVPGQPGVTADSVEGVWQGLKVFDRNTGIDTSYFEGRGKKRRGAPLGHDMGGELVDYATARKQIYLPTYQYMVENTPAQNVALSLMNKALNGETLYVHDFDTNGNVNDTSKPLAHASVLASIINTAVSQVRASEDGLTPTNLLASKYLSKQEDAKMTVKTFDYDSFLTGVNDGRLAATRHENIRIFVDVMPGNVGPDKLTEAVDAGIAAALAVHRDSPADRILSAAKRRMELFERGTLDYVDDDGEEIAALQDPLAPLLRYVHLQRSFSAGEVTPIKVELLGPDSRDCLVDWPDELLPDDNSHGLFEKGVFDYFVTVGEED